MNTYLLIGNPSDGREGGMSRQDYQERFEYIKRQGFADDHWTMWKFDSKPGDQVVLLRTGGEKPGLIGFGLRRAGDWLPGFKDRREYPVRFHNLKSLHDEPYISRSRLRGDGFWREGNFPGSGTKLSPEELLALERCCEKELKLSLSSLCGGPAELDSATTEGQEISSQTDASPTTGPLPSPWTATVEHSVTAPAWTYAFRFGERQVWKVGHAEDVDERLAEIKKHVPDEVLGEQWKPALHHRWKNAIYAWEMEQKIFDLLAAKRTVGERIKCSQRELENAWSAALSFVRARQR